MTEQEPLVEQPEPEKEETPKEWVEGFEKILIEVSGSGLYTDGHGNVEPDASTREAALVLVAIRMKDSIKDEVLVQATGLSINKVQRIKQNMRMNRMLFSHRGCRNPSVQLSNWDEPGMAGIMAYTLDCMTAAGKLARIQVDENGNQL